MSLDKSFELSGIPVAGRSHGPVRILGLLAVCTLPLAIFWGMSRYVGGLIIGDDSFSQALLIPFVSAFLIYQNRARIFSTLSFGWSAGASLLVPGCLLLAAAQFNVWHLRPTNRGVLFSLGVVLIWQGAFGMFLGEHALREARFPLVFLLFSISIPEPMLSGIVSFLQKESADMAEIFFRLGGVPYFRRELIFDLPGVAIRVAEECSGIRSSLALLITTVLASYLFLKSSWRRLILCAVVVPLAIVKNGLRIATLSTLAIYVDPGFLYGNLHHRGGIVFFVIILIPMALLLNLLLKSEARRPI